MKKPLHCFLKANNPSPTTEAPFPGASDLLTNARIRRRLTSIFYQSEDLHPVLLATLLVFTPQ